MADVNDSGPGENTRLQKWVDPAMFKSEELNASAGPQVFLLQAPNDPLGAVAAMCAMYEGRVVRDLAEVTDADRRRYLAEMQKTKLTTPLESVQFHFMIEGVTRSFTHQMVRQRTAAYAQESLRFAVVEDGFVDRVATPPSLIGARSYERALDKALDELGRTPVNDDELAEYIDRHATDKDRNLWEWDEALNKLDAAYKVMISRGMPAEDARGLLPHSMTTRLHYVTDLRGLLDHAGNRLCTQAQFEWRLVFARIAAALRQYGGHESYKHLIGKTADPNLNERLGWTWEWRSAGWQYEALADLLRPVCYQKGSCAFGADFDRACSIRDRVQANARLNRSSSEWHEPKFLGKPHWSNPPERTVPWHDKESGRDFIPPINPAEWAADPGAAR